jgi:hypothetical protein
LALALAFSIPLSITPHLLFYYDITPKVALILLGATAGLALLFLQFDWFYSLAGTPLGRWYAIAAAVSLGITIFAASFSTNSSLAWYGSNWRRYGAITECAAILVAVAISAYVAGNTSSLRAILRALSVAGLLASLYGIAQYFRWDPFLPAGVYEAGEGPFTIVRPPSTLGHADYFAAFLLWPVFTGIGLAREERRGVWRVLAISGAIAGMAAIVLSGTRGALVALAVGLCVSAALWRPRFRVVAGSFAFGALGLSLFYFSPAGARLRARAHWIGEDRAGGARLLLFRDSVRMAASKPITGFGPENFVAEFPRFQSVELARAYPDFAHESPHNIFLDSLTAEGIGGMLALAAIAAIGIVAGLRFSSALSGGLLAGLFATLAAHQFIAFTAPTAFYFYLAIGLLVGIGGMPAQAPAGLSSLRWLLLPGAALFAVLACRLLAADALLATVERRLNAGNPSGAAEAYRSALKQPTAVSADLYFSRCWATAAANFTDTPSRLYYSQVALGAASLAARLPEHRQNGWYMLAMLAAARQDRAAVESALRSTIAAGPNWYKPHWALARLLIGEVRIREAEAEAQTALRLNAGRDPEVAATLAWPRPSSGTAGR